MEWRSRFDSEEYRNWVAVGSALSLLCDGVRSYLDREMKVFHGRLLVAVGAVTKCLCVHTPHRKPNPWHDMINCRWAAAIQNYHTGNPKKIAWRQSNSNVWDDPVAGPWEIAKVFMSDLGPDSHLVVDAQSTDPTGLLNLVRWCQYLGVPQHLVDDVREIRNNKWAHNANQQISNDEMNDAFRCVKNLLKDPVFAGSPNAATYLHQIEQLENCDLVILQEAEVNVLHDLKHLMVTERQEIVKRMNSIQSTIETIEHSLVTDGGREGPCITTVLTILQMLQIFLRAIHRRSKFLLLLVCMISYVQLLGNGTVSDGCEFDLSESDESFREFDFTGSLDLAREHFTGRKWLFHELEGAFEINRDDVKGVVILGAPGSGKSAFLAQLICSRTSSIYIHNNTIAYHICSYSNRKTQNAASFVRNIVSIMIRRVKEYQELVESNSAIRHALHNLCPLKPSACFRKAVLEPLREIEEKQLKPNINFILIDALDECTPMDTRTETDILTVLREQLRYLPNSVKIITTSRHMKRLSALGGGFTKLEIKATDPKNIEDIDSYVTRRVYEKYSRFLGLNLRMLFGTDNRHKLVTIMGKLVNQSQGNFLFVREVLHFSLTSAAGGHDIQSIPQSLGDMYQKYFERAFPTRQTFRSVQPILEILVASVVPVSLEDIFAILHAGDTDTAIEYEFDFKINQLSHFLRYGSKETTVSLYHRTIAEWLTSSENKGNLYYVLKHNGCRRLADFYLAIILNGNTTLTAHTIFEVAQYISCAGMVENHLKLFKSFPSNIIINLKPSRGSLLHDAALLGDSDVTKLLLYHFHDVDIVDEDGFTPAFLSVIHGFRDNLETFHSAGANINHFSKQCATIADAGGFEIDCAYLRNIGRRFRLQHCGSTMLHASAVHGHASTMKYLLENNVNLELRSNPDFSALQLAAEFGNLVTVRLLYNAGLKPTHSVLRSAVANDHIDIAAYLLNNGVKDSCVNCNEIFNIIAQERLVCLNDEHILFCESALHTAVRLNNADMVKLLTNSESSVVNCPDVTGLLPIHHAVINRNWNLINLLLSQGADKDASCHPQTEERLLDYVSDCEEQTYFKTTCGCSMKPLHFAAMLGFTEIVSVLVNKYEADVLAMDCNGATPLHVAACHNQLNVFEVFVDMNVDPNTRSLNGSTPLHSAALCGATEILIDMRKHGADILASDDNNMKAIHYFVKGRFSTVPYIRLDDYTTLERLHGLNEWKQTLRLLGHSKQYIDIANTADNNGQTILHTLALNGNVVGVMAVVLLADENNLNLAKYKDNSGQNALDLTLTRIEDILLDERQSSFDRSRIDEFSGDYDYVIYILLQYGGLFELMEKEKTCTSYFFRILKNRLQLSTKFVFDKVVNGICEDLSEEKLLFHYLRDEESVSAALRFAGYNEAVPILCNKFHNQSALHLLASRMTDFAALLNRTSLSWTVNQVLQFDFEKYHPVFLKHQRLPREGAMFNSIYQSRNDLDKCLDFEGYTLLHRAAQASNVPAIKMFLSLGANVSIVTPEGYNNFMLAILHAINIKLNKGQSTKQMTIGAAIGNHKLDIRLASEAVTILLRHAVERGFTETCSRDLTLFHYAASRGMYELIQSFFREFNFYEMDFVCKDKYDVTPLYLAQLYEGLRENNENRQYRHMHMSSTINSQHFVFPSNFPWQRVIQYITENIDNLPDKHVYPRRSAELYMIYNYLYRHTDPPFLLDLTDEVLLGLGGNTKSNKCRGFIPRSDDSMISFHLHGSETLYEWLSVERDVGRILQSLNNTRNTSFYIAIAEIKHRNEEFSQMFLNYANEKSELYQISVSEGLVLKQARLSRIDAETRNTLIIYFAALKQFIYKYIYELVHNNFATLSRVTKVVSRMNVFIRCRYVYAYGSHVVRAFKNYAELQERKGRVAVITHFIKRRMEWKWPWNYHEWPLRFLVRMALNDTEHLSYLRTLNVGV